MSFKMQTLKIENPHKIKKAVPLIESKIKIRLSLIKDNLTIKGNEYNSFIVSKIIQAIDFGFEPDDALLLLDEDYVMEFISIKDCTKRRNLFEVRSRVIGTKGKAKKTIESLTGSSIVIKDNKVGIIVDSDHLDAIVQAITSLAGGAKHGNVFSYLEKQNIELGKIDREDLGLRNPNS